MEGCFGVAYWNPRDGGASYDLETSKSMEIKINKFKIEKIFLRRMSSPTPTSNDTLL